jgi:hypothetical protein
MKRLLAIFIILVSSLGFGQNSNWEWATRIGAMIDDGVAPSLEKMSTAIATDLQGNIYVAGLFSDSIVNNGFRVYSHLRIGFNRPIDAFIAKYTADGDLLWIKSFGNQVSVTSAVTDMEGNLYVGGQTSETIKAGDTSVTATADGYVVKCSADGVFEWVMIAEGFGVTKISGLSARGNTIYVTGSSLGYYSDSIKFGGRTVFNTGGFLAAFHQDRSVEWLTNIPSEDILFPSCVTGVVDGCFVSCNALNKESTYILADDTVKGTSIVIKFNTNGIPVFANAINGGAINAIASSSEFVCAVGPYAEFVSIGNITFENPAGIFVATYDRNGIFSHLRVGVGGAQRADGICVDSLGLFNVAGSFSNRLTFDEQSVNREAGFGLSGFVARFDPVDNKCVVLASQNADIRGTCILSSIAVTSDNQTVTSGIFTDSLAFGSTRLFPERQFFPDVATAKLGRTTSYVAATPLGATRMKLSPSPATMATTLRYELSQACKVSVRLFDLLGRKVIVHEVGLQEEGDHSLRLDVSELPVGFYYVTLNADGATLQHTPLQVIR